MTDRPAVRPELLQPIGRSERAEVFHGRDGQRGEAVVVKRFAAGRVSAEALPRFVATLATLRRASPRGLVLPLAPITTGDELLAIYPRLAGSSLDELMRAGFVPSWSGAADIVGRSAEILAATSEATGLCHRALKPTNIWLAPSGEVSLLDFGIAELGVTAVGPREGPVFVEYRAPEQLEGAPGDARSDVFTLAVLLCELSTGVHPFAGSSAFQVARQLLVGGPPSTALVTRGMGDAGAREAEKLLVRSLTRAPAERFADVQEFLRALQFARRVIGTPADQGPVPAPVRPPARVIAVVEDPTTMMQLPGPRAPTVVRSPPEEPATIVAVSARPSAAPPQDERTEARPLPAAAGAHIPVQPASRKIDAPEESRTIEFSRPAAASARSAAAFADELPTSLHIARPARPAARPAVEPTLELPRDSAPARPPTVASEDSTALAPPSSGDRSHRVLFVLNVLCVALVLCGLVLLAIV